MHFHFPFSVGQIFWALTFAAQLVLLVVLLGRDRMRLYPWFSASIVLYAFRLLVEVLLFGRLPVPTLRILFIVLADLAVIVGLLVVVEMARRAFAGASHRVWIAGAAVLLVVAGAAAAFWGPWPPGKELIPNSLLATLRLMHVLAQKGDLLIDVLTVQLGVLVAGFGRRFHAGWHSHTQRIVIGLSTVAASWLAIEGIWQVIATTAHPHTQAEYERLVGLGTRMVNANRMIYIAVLVWWIVCLWLDEPGQAAAAQDPDASALSAPGAHLPGEPGAD